MPDNLSIMLLDDDMESLESLSVALSERGYAITRFSRPESAIRAFSEERYDVVLTDLKMPGMNGLEVLRTVRELDPGVRVIMITAFADENSRIESIRAGASAFFSKPLNLKILLETLSAIHRNSEANGLKPPAFKSRTQADT